VSHMNSRTSLSFSSWDITIHNNRTLVYDHTE
jgi:hypothetical protein